MNMDCEVVRDLLPLYADDACSEKSRELVEAHLQACPDCGELLRKLKDTRIESDLRSEKALVLQYGARRFRRRTAAVGSLVSGLLMIPILACLVVNIISELTMSWFFVALAAMCVAASLIVVPLTVPEDKLFWTFCAFCASLMALLGVTCLYTRGDWFWIAASATLFGLSAVFLPFAIRARPLRKLIGGRSRMKIVLGVDAVLFLNMMYVISHRQRSAGPRALIVVGVVAGAALLALEILKKRRGS